MNHRELRFSATPMGIVEQSITLQKPGRVSYEATCWPARLPRTNHAGSITLDESLTLRTGQQVKVIGREGITLLVIPVKDE